MPAICQREPSACTLTAATGLVWAGCWIWSPQALRTLHTFSVMLSLCATGLEVHFPGSMTVDACPEAEGHSAKLLAKIDQHTSGDGWSPPRQAKAPFWPEGRRSVTTPRDSSHSRSDRACARLAKNLCCTHSEESHWAMGGCSKRIQVRQPQRVCPSLMPGLARSQARELHSDDTLQVSILVHSHGTPQEEFRWKTRGGRASRLAFAKGYAKLRATDSGLDAFSQYPSHGSLAAPVAQLTAETRGVARGFLSYYHMLP